MTTLLAIRCLPKDRLVHAFSRFAFWLRSLAGKPAWEIDMTYVNSGVPIAGVNVDNDFARFGGKSYAINKINSIEVRETAASGRAVAIISGIVSGIFLIVLLASGLTLGPLIAAIIYGTFSWLYWNKSEKREYRLYLMTSSAETQAFITRDYHEVHALRQRIETAMLYHSRLGMQ
ncbi:DUF6232 family protein [Sphingomonas sp. CFBP 8760]|uniref:DUF6232 family protein n=1 Tax=Sphingomonas sp. CFBP 8760 TaxID=2775282 RepID=UPI001A92EB4E|nr:DUF6232 family protein [Sphingomonas sp. CFBP 8760]